MLNKEIINIVKKSHDLGWILEPDAKALMNMTGLDIPDFVLTNSFKEANEFLKSKSSPLVAKFVQQAGSACTSNDSTTGAKKVAHGTTKFSGPAQVLSTSVPQSA